MIIILLDIKDGDVWCLCVWVSRWLLLTAMAPSHTYNDEGKVLDLRGFQGIAQTTERKTPSLSLLCSSKPISYRSSLLNTQNDNWHNLSCKCLFLFFKEKKTWILQVILDAIPFWWVKWSSGVILISKKEKQLSRVSYIHTCCHCYNYWFSTESCPKSFYDQFSCATKGVQSVIYIVEHYKECFMKLGALF